MKKTNTTAKNAANQITVNVTEHVDLFETMCATSNSKEACRRYVERLEEAALNMTQRRTTSG